MSAMAWPLKLVFRKSDGALYAEFDDGKFIGRFQGTMTKN